jgi:hypothetical protein
LLGTSHFCKIRLRNPCRENDNDRIRNAKFKLSHMKLGSSREFRNSILIGRERQFVHTNTDFEQICVSCLTENRFFYYLTLSDLNIFFTISKKKFGKILYSKN